MNDEKGVWRTIRGRRIFIANGQSLGEAMAKSGKFKNLTRTKLRETRHNEREKDLFGKYGKKKVNWNRFQKNDQWSIENRGAEQAKKNRLNEYAINWKENDGVSLKEAGLKFKVNSRVEANLDKYSDKDRRELYHEKLQKKLADYKAKKQSNNKVDPYDDPESNESQRLQSIQSRYDEYLQDTEGRGASYGEIAYVDSLRGKDLDDFEKELDDYETKKYNKQEKATKKTKKDNKDWLPKATEIKEQGTSNRKEVSDNIQAHILEYYGPDYTGEDISPEDAFVRQMDAMKEPTMWKSGQRIAEGGSYLVYNGDMSDFLDSLKINPKGKKFSEDKAFNMYTSLIGRESAKLYDKIKKHQAETINNYKKRKGK